MSNVTALDAERDRHNARTDEIFTLRQQRTSLNKALKENDDPAKTPRIRTALSAVQNQIERLESQRTRSLGRIDSLSGGLSHSLANEQGQIFGSPEMFDTLEQLASSNAPIGRMALGHVMGSQEYADMLRSGNWGYNLEASGNIFAASGPVTIDEQVRYGPSYGVVPQLRRRLSILDLIPSRAADAGSSFFFLAESFTTDAAETAELALKPEADYTGTPQQVKFQTLAHYLKVARQSLADVVGLGTALGNRLTYGVNKRLEDAILGGNGTGVNMLGILNTTGVQNVAFASGTPLADLVLSGVIALQNAFAEPQAIVISPSTWSNLLTPKSTGSGEYLNVGQGPVGLPMSQTLWGIPVIVNSAMPVNKALVADFANGCELFVRQGMTLLTSDSDSDDFIRNRLTLLAELRAGLATWQPSAFAIVNLA